MRSLVTLLSISVVLASTAVAQDRVRVTRTTTTEEIHPATVESSTRVQVVRPAVEGQVASSRIVDLSRQIASGAKEIQAELDRPVRSEKPEKLGKTILRSLLNDGGERRSTDSQNPALTDLNREADALVRTARDLHHDERRGNDIDIQAERDFIKEFRTVEQIAADVERTLTRPAARELFAQQIAPALTGLRAELPSLTAFREAQERQEVRREVKEVRREVKEVRRDGRRTGRRSSR